MTRLLDHATAAANDLPPDVGGAIAHVILRLTGADEETTHAPLSPDERTAVEASKANARCQIATDEQLRTICAQRM